MLSGHAIRCIFSSCRRATHVRQTVTALIATVLLGAIACPTASQAAQISQTFNCVTPPNSAGIQPWVVPDGVTGISALVEGAPGTTPGHGSGGGYGGLTQGNLAVISGQTLDVWVGCSGPQIGYGFGGLKGVASFFDSGDGGFGGGGSAVTESNSSATPLLVAGGGGGGGGNGPVYEASTGGPGGNGGLSPQPGTAGSNAGTGGGSGGCVDCQPPGEINGLNGDGASTGGGGGGGGGGYTGGGGGGGGPAFSGGGGGGGGTSYADPSAAAVSFGTSPLTGDGLVVLTWSVAGLGSPEPVPEPGTGSLVTAALAGLAVSRRRRRRPSAEIDITGPS